MSSHLDKLTSLYDKLHQNTYLYTGASINQVDGNIIIKLGVQYTDLKRY